MESKGINVAAIPQTAIKVITTPQAFFREMPKTGGFLDPLLFMVVMGVVSGIIQAVLMVVGLHPMAGIAMAFSAVIFYPVAIAIGGFIGAAIMFVIWKLMGSQESYETAYRCTAYIGALTPITTVLGIIPYAGSAIGLGITLFYIVTASVEVHKIPSQKAWMVFGIIAAVLILFSISAQFAARRAARHLEETAKEMQKQAEQAGKAAEQWQKEMQKQSEDSKKAAEQMQKQMEEMQKQMKK